MLGLTADTFKVPPNMDNKADGAVLYVRSYLLIRTAVGLIGMLLPIILIVAEAFFLKGSVRIRGSLSAYYHSPMQDIFVGCLCVTGFLLITYMSGMPKTWDFWLSLIAGVAVLAVVFFPTWRSNAHSGPTLCGSNPQPPGCSPVEQTLGEAHTAIVHSIAAAIFILSLAAISFLFARREKIYNNSVSWMRFHICCGAAILLAVLWVVIGGALKRDVWQLTPLYLGEIVSVWAFGASWFVKGKNLRRMLHPVSPPNQSQQGDTPSKPFAG